MQINRLLLTAALIIITGCNTTPLHSNRETNAVPGSTAERILLDIPHQHGATRTRRAQDTAAELPVTAAARTDMPAPGDIWKRIGSGLSLDRHLAQQSVKEKLAWYRRNQAYLDRVADRARPYLYFIVEELERRDMPLDLALLPIVESAYHPFAHSPSRASGIWQFIPSTGIRYGLKQNWWYDGRRDIVAATDAALDYLAMLNHEFNGDWLLALAAYNMGEKNVAKAIRRNRQMGKKHDFWSLSLPRETRGYVPSLLAVAELVANPERNGIVWKPIQDRPYFDQVETGGQMDLALVAELSAQTMDEVYTLNPAFNRWATDPDGPHRLLLPVDKTEVFKSKLSTLPPSERISWSRHVIKPGESLSAIAQRYHIGIDALKQANNIRGNLIHTGTSLLIPTSRRPVNQYTLSMDSRRHQGLEKTGTGQKYIYTVQRGDTLWDIGQRYGLSVERLCAWNGIPASRTLRLGQKLTLWLAPDQEAPAVGKPAPAANGAMLARAQTTDTGQSVYTVQTGDNLWLIAKRFGMTVAQLMSLNNLVQGSLLRPGQKLNLLPVSYNNTATPDSTATHYTVQKGDNLWLIARKYGTTVQQLLQWNNLSDSERLQPGQTLVLYINEA